MRLRTFCLSALGMAIGLSALSALAQNNDQGAARIVTYNLDEGTDYQEVLGPALYDPPLLPAAVQLTIDNVRATNPPGRMAAIASQLAATQPDLVGLQEATQWRTSETCADSVAPEFDLLQLLLSDLAALGQHYAAVAIIREFDFTAVTPAGSCVRASNRDAILARTDLTPGQFQLSNIQAVKCPYIQYSNRPDCASAGMGFGRCFLTRAELSVHYHSPGRWHKRISFQPLPTAGGRRIARGAS